MKLSTGLVLGATVAIAGYVAYRYFNKENEIIEGDVVVVDAPRLPAPTPEKPKEE